MPLDNKTVEHLRAALASLDADMERMRKLRGEIATAITRAEIGNPLIDNGKKGKKMYQIPTPVDPNAPRINITRAGKGGKKSKEIDKSPVVETRYSIGKSEIIPILAKATEPMTIVDICAALSAKNKGVRYTTSAVETCLKKHKNLWALVKGVE